MRTIIAVLAFVVSGSAWAGECTDFSGTYENGSYLGVMTQEGCSKLTVVQYQNGVYEKTQQHRTDGVFRQEENWVVASKHHAGFLEREFIYFDAAANAYISYEVSLSLNDEGDLVSEAWSRNTKTEVSRFLGLAKFKRLAR